MIMSTPQEQVKTGGLKNVATNAENLIEEAKRMGDFQGLHGTRKVLNSELWHACAGPLVSLPQPGSLVYYFPQGHIEQVTATTRRTANSYIPNYPGLPSQMMCHVQTVTLHADKDTDEIYAQMTLQPVSSENKIFSTPDIPLSKYKQPYEFFCKTLTASDTSTHGGFSVPRRAAEKLFPQLDYSMQPPNQELVVRDLHENFWTFRHIYRGQPKRHLLTTGWSVFVGAKRLKAGDSVLFIRDEKSQLLFGVRRMYRQQSVLPSSVLSADSMLMGVLAAAAHAAVNRSPFTVYYNPRACPSEFIVPLSKYQKASGAQISTGMRFGMMFGTEDLSTRRCMGTIIGITDCDPFRWPRSKWRNLQVEWDENGCVDRPDRVNIWEIEPLESLFVFAAPAMNLKRQYNQGGVGEIGLENVIKRLVSQASENGNGDVIYRALPGLDSEQLLKAPLKPHSPGRNTQVGYCQSMYATLLPNMQGAEPVVASPTVAAWHQMAKLAQTKTVTESGKHQIYQLPFDQKLLPPIQNHGGQNQNPQQCLELQHMADSDLACSTHIPQEQIAKCSPSDKKDEVENELDEQKSNNSIRQFKNTSTHGRDTVKLDLTSARVADQLDKNPDGNTSPSAKQLYSEQQNQFPSKNNEENMAVPLKPENLVTQVLPNQGPAKKLHGDLFMQQKFEQNSIQIPQLETSLADTTNTLPLHPHYHSSESLSGLRWMSNPSSLQPFSSTSKSHGFLPISSKPDSPQCASEIDTSSSADISAVVKLEKCTPIQRTQFQCFPESSSSQCLPISGQELLRTNQTNLSWDIPQIEQHGAGQLEDPTVLSSEVHDMSVSREVTTLHNGYGDFSDETGDQSENYNDLHFEVNTETMTVHPSVLSTGTEGFGIMGSYSSDISHITTGLVGNFSTCQDIQSQINSTSFLDSQAFSVHEFPDSSGGTSSSNLDFDENYFLNKASWKQVSPRLRTYTKVQKLGSVGRSIDVTGFRNYNELKSAIACLFGLEEQLDDLEGSGWKLVYVDYENDVLLVGDDPWEDFVSCVRCIRILSPPEVQQMSQEGLHLHNNYFTPQIDKSSFLDGGHSWDFQHF